jgi:hypothetical protein
MRDPVFLLLPIVLAASRSFAIGMQSSRKSGTRPPISVETEYQILLIVIFCLTGLLATLNVMIQFPDFGEVIAEYNQI